jgi:hypothetical protein
MVLFAGVSIGLIESLSGVMRRGRWRSRSICCEDTICPDPASLPAHKYVNNIKKI